MKRQKTKAQHYVPQFYLERFATDDKVFAYDKLEDASFPSAAKNIGQQRYFYDLDPELLEAEHKDAAELQIAEEALSVIEGQAAETFRLILKEKELRPLRWRLQQELAAFMAIQYLRTPSARERIVQMANASLAAIELDLPAGTAGEINPEDSEFRVAESHHHVLHLKTLFNPALWDGLARELLKHVWILATPPEGSSFWTSDHPIARKAHITGKPESHRGLASEGIEIAYPLSSSCLLILREKSFHPESKCFDKKCIELTAEEVEAYNLLQVRDSGRWVYSNADNFESARELCSEEPILRQEQRSQVSVFQGPAYDEKGTYLGDVVQFRSRD